MQREVKFEYRAHPDTQSVHVVNLATRRSICNVRLSKVQEWLPTKGPLRCGFCKRGLIDFQISIQSDS